MAAPLTGPRDAKKRIGEVWNYPVKLGEIIYKGAAVCLDANGEAVNASAIATLVTAGVARDTVDNTDGDKRLDVEEGIYMFHNSPPGADQIVQGDARHLCYWVDNHTVAAVATGRPIAGVIKSLDGTLVSVDIVSFAAPAAPPVAGRRESDKPDDHPLLPGATTGNPPGAGVGTGRPGHPRDTTATSSDYKAP